LDISVFKTGKFLNNSDTKLICPDCNIGHLIASKANLQQVEYRKYNLEVRACDDSDPDWYKFSFHGFLECNNPECKEKIVVSGKYVYTGWYEDENTPEGAIELEEYYPEYFERPPKIIQINDKYPADIQQILLSSFSLFWIDKAACANRLRYCIEKILDTFSVPRNRRAKGKLFPLSLHARIQKFCNNNEKYKTVLLAVKWIGNSGSHDYDVKSTNILDAYRLIDYMLKQLYANDEKEILKLSKSINKRKGK
jgi:hypothetical protein